MNGKKLKNNIPRNCPFFFVMNRLTSPYCGCSLTHYDEDYHGQNMCNQCLMLGATCKDSYPTYLECRAFSDWYWNDNAKRS